MNFRLMLAALVLSPAAAWAAPVQTPHVEAELVAENTALKPGSADNWLALRLKPEDGWHVYWQNPGDSGLPTQIRWTLPADYSTGAIQWPYPHSEKLGELTNYGYSEDTLHLVALSVPAGASGQATLKAEAKWLVCKDICIPGKADLELSLPLAAQTPADTRWQAAFARTRAQLPQATTGTGLFQAEGGELRLALGAEVLGQSLAAGTAVEFFPLAGDLVAHAKPQRSVIENGGLRLAQKLSDYYTAAPEQVEGVLVVGHGETARAYQVRSLPGTVAAVATDAPVAGATADHAAPALIVVLALAVLGGLILNLMPCVFPVLSLKAVALLQSAEAGHAHRRHALSYTAGVVLSCVAVAGLLLGLRAGGEAIGWGFQLQSPVFVGLLAYLLFALGLSLSGAAEFGTGLMGLGQSLTQKQGLAGSFFTGVLATVVASPCTAPFMGTALGYAVTQPAAVALLVFAALGLGLALPFLLLGYFPALARALPRPGAWMESFKQAMAFPLYLTAVWLLWVLMRQTGADGGALLGIGLVLIAFALWLWRRPGLLRRLLGAAALAGALALLAHPLLRAAPATAAPDAAGEHQAWSLERVTALRAEQRTIFVNFTADWCITCKVNERVALGSSAVHAAMQQHNVAWLTGDWTRSDPAITAELARYGRNGVPLYLVYVKGADPVVLPQILTPDIVIESLTKE